MHASRAAKNIRRLMMRLSAAPLGRNVAYFSTPDGRDFAEQHGRGDRARRDVRGCARVDATTDRERERATTQPHVERAARVHGGCAADRKKRPQGSPDADRRGFGRITRGRGARDTRLARCRFEPLAGRSWLWRRRSGRRIGRSRLRGAKQRARVDGDAHRERQRVDGRRACTRKIELSCPPDGAVALEELDGGVVALFRTRGAPDLDDERGVGHREERIVPEAGGHGPSQLGLVRAAFGPRGTKVHEARGAGRRGHRCREHEHRGERRDRPVAETGPTAPRREPT